MIVLPGSKNTLADLHWLRATGLAEAILAAARAGRPVIGICGGYQMLGEKLTDVSGLAGDRGDAVGLGLLPVATTFTGNKIVRQVTAQWSNRRWTAYEIHVGRTKRTGPCLSLQSVTDLDGQTRVEGSRKGNVWGTYLHGWFEAPEVRQAVADAAGMSMHRAHPVPWANRRQAVYAGMAAHVAAHVDLDSVRHYLGL